MPPRLMDLVAVRDQFPPSSRRGVHGSLDPDDWQRSSVFRQYVLTAQLLDLQSDHTLKHWIPWLLLLSSISMLHQSYVLPALRW